MTGAVGVSVAGDPCDSDSDLDSVSDAFEVLRRTSDQDERPLGLIAGTSTSAARIKRVINYRDH